MIYLPAAKFFIEKKPLASVIVPAEILESFILANSAGLPPEITLPRMVAVCADTVIIKTLKRKVTKDLSKGDFIARKLFCLQIYNC
jgi:hypothetical protein